MHNRKVVKNVGEKRGKSKKRAYVLLMLTVFSCVSLTVFALAFNPTGNGQKAPSQVSTAGEAITIAMPTVEQYAKENNRTITTVEATFSDSSPPSTSLGEIANDTLSRPHWGIEVGFEPVNDIDVGIQYWIYGYYIEVWADTGEIRYYNEQGNY
jgi:hypothetical protein